MPSVPCSSSSTSSPRPSDGVYALIGAFTYGAPGGTSPGDPAQGLSVYDTTKLPWQALQVAATPNPSFMVLHPDGHLLYTVNEVTHHAGQPCGAIQVYRVERDPPHLRWLAERALAPGATGPTHIAIDPHGQHLVVSAYTGGQFNLFELNAQGIPGEVCDVLAHTALPASDSSLPGSDPERQEAPHAHQAMCAPDGGLWICCDLGADMLSLFRLQHARFELSATYRTPPGTGPRHAAFHPTQPWVYVINELAVTLTVFTYGPSGLVPVLRHAAATRSPAQTPQSPTGALRPSAGTPPLPTDKLRSSAGTSLLPEGVHDGCGASALVMHPGGKWLYASTKGVDSDDNRADSVSAWSIDQASGALSLLWRHTHEIKGARAMTLSEDGSSLYVLNQTAGTVMQLDIDPQSGAHGAARIVALAPTPTCLTFSRHRRPPVA